MSPSEEFHMLWLLLVFYYYLKALGEFHLFGRVTFGADTWWSLVDASASEVNARAVLLHAPWGMNRCAMWRWSDGQGAMALWARGFGPSIPCYVQDVCYVHFGFMSELRWNPAKSTTCKLEARSRRIQVVATRCDPDKITPNWKKSPMFLATRNLFACCDSVHLLYMFPTASFF